MALTIPSARPLYFFNNLNFTDIVYSNEPYNYKYKYPAKPKVREAAYKMLVRPKLEYGSKAWSPHTQNNIDTLEKIHL